MAGIPPLGPLPVQTPLEDEQDDDDSSILPYEPTPATQEPKQQQERWPQLTTLVRDHEEIVLKILRAVDECKATLEMNATIIESSLSNVPPFSSWSTSNRL